MHNQVLDIFFDICSKVGIMVRKVAPMGFLLEAEKDLRSADLLLCMAMPVWIEFVGPYDNLAQ